MESDLKPMNFFVCPSCWQKVEYIESLDGVSYCPYCDRAQSARNLVNETCRYKIKSVSLGQDMQGHFRYLIRVWFSDCGDDEYYMIYKNPYVTERRANEWGAYEHAIRFIKDDQIYMGHFKLAQYTKPRYAKLEEIKTRWDSIEI